MSPIMFLLAFNPLLQLAADLYHGHGYVFQLPLQHSEDLPPVDSTVYKYVKWLEQSDESPGWYQAIVPKYFQDGKLVYDDTPNATVSETVNLDSVKWMPCAKRAKHYVSLDYVPKSLTRNYLLSTIYLQNTLLRAMLMMQH